jgi:(1->4)-alpha-D-glucan 1-alpha-D-glucosylmutase
VDYDRRQRMLEELHAAVSAADDDRRALARDLVATKEDGRIKLYVTSQALHSRLDHPGLFTAGEYLPLAATGDKADHLFAFARRVGDSWAIVAVPRLLTRLIPDPGRPPTGHEVWGETKLSLVGIPPELRWRNVFTGVDVSGAASDGEEPELAAVEVFADFSVALLLSEQGD